MQNDNTTSPKISVIIPVYNCADYLGRCLNSVLGQTHADIEVICVNDGSTDNSAEVLAQYAASDKRMKVLSQENRGQSAARNAAMKQASGDYVFFVDADDFIHPQTFAVMLAAVQKSGAPVAATVEVKRHDATPIEMADLRFETHKNPLKHILQNEASGSVIWNKLYRREIVQNRPFIEGIYFEDWPWVTCLFADIEKYVTVPYALYGYNTDNTSTMRSIFTVKKVSDFVTGIRAVKQYFAAPRLQHLWPTVRKIRISASVKHMVNAVYHETENRAELDAYLLEVLRQLHREECFKYAELTFKVKLRIFKVWLRNGRKKWLKI